MNHKTDMHEALQLCIDAMLHDGVPTDPEHPKRIALNAAESALASRPDAQAKIGATGWKLAMRVMQSDLFDKLDDAERAECDALVRANPYLGRSSTTDAQADERGAIYQVSFSDDDGWLDANKKVYDSHPEHARRIVFADAAPQPSQDESDLCERIIHAVEGECDGLAITEEQASNILAYLQYGAPMCDMSEAFQIIDNAIGSAEDYSPEMRSLRIVTLRIDAARKVRAALASQTSEQPIERGAVEIFSKLHNFLNAAGAEGLVLDGIDGGDLFMSIFDADGNVSDRVFSSEVRALAFQELFEFQEATGFDTAEEYRAVAPQAEAAQGLADDVRAAVERMCAPLHESRLSGVTAQEDARCMKLIRDYVLGTDAAAPSPDREQVREDSRRVDELSMLIRQLVHALRKAAPDNDLAGRAGDYLKRAGLQGSPLRVEAPDAPPSREYGEQQECPHGVDDGACGWCYDEKAASAPTPGEQPQAAEPKGMTADEYTRKFEALCGAWCVNEAERKTAKLFWLEARALLAKGE